MMFGEKTPTVRHLAGKCLVSLSTTMFDAMITLLLDENMVVGEFIPSYGRNFYGSTG